MGDPLSTATQAFSTEFEKSAVQFTGLRELAFRLGSPLKGLKKGIEQLSPTKLIQHGGEMGQQLQSAVNRTSAAQKALDTGKKVKILDHAGQPVKSWFGFGKPIEYSGKTLPGKARAFMATKLRAGTHLAPDAQLSEGVKGLAERASRSGWTGEGAMTKYLPIGQKGMLTAGTMMSMPGIVDAVRYGPSEQFGGIGEQVGSLAGFTLPALMMGGMPNASFVTPLLGSFAGGRMGKALDRRLDPRVKAMERALPQEANE